MLGVYLILTTAYSLLLKRKMLLDAVCLAASTHCASSAAPWPSPFRSRAGFSPSRCSFSCRLRWSSATSNSPNSWTAACPTLPTAPTSKGDLPVVASLAAAAGYNAVIVLALYMSSDAVAGLYRSPELLWLVCPIMMYWISRLIMKAHRRVVDDDPVVYALKDPISLGVAAAIAILGLLAI